MYLSHPNNTMPKITINSNDLKSAVSITGRVVKADALVQIMASVLLHCQGGRAYFTGVNEQLTVLTSVPCEHDEEFSIAVEHADLNNLSAEAPSGSSIAMEIDDKYALSATIGRSRLTYTGFAPSLFPSLPNVDRDTATILSMDSQMIMCMVTAINFTDAISTIFPAMAAVVIDSTDKELVIVSCSHTGLYMSKSFSLPVGVRRTMLPAAAIKMLPAFDAAVSVELVLPEGNPNHVAFQKDGTTLYVRLMEGSYPKYELIIPKDYERSIRFNADEFLKAVRVVTVGAAADSKGTILFTVKGNQATVEYDNHTKGKRGVSEFELINNKDGDIVLGLNAKVLLNHLSALSGEATLTHNGDPMQPSLLSDESEDAIQIIMPSHFNH